MQCLFEVQFLLKMNLNGSGLNVQVAFDICIQKSVLFQRLTWHIKETMSVLSYTSSNLDFKGPLYTDHILIPQGSTGSSRAYIFWY